MSVTNLSFAQIADKLQEKITLLMDFIEENHLQEEFLSWLEEKKKTNDVKSVGTESTGK